MAWHSPSLTLTAGYLTAGLLATGLVAQRGDGPAWRLADPVRISADGAAIDTGADIAHAGPLVKDYDGDGLADLLVSSFRGNIRFFKNVGTATQPAFQEGKRLQAGGEDLRIHNW